MIEGGLMLKWILRYWPKPTNCDADVISEAHALSLEETAGVFIMLLVGVFIATQVLLIEKYRDNLLSFIRRLFTRVKH